MKHHSRRKNAKRRYKHLMAALAGAAVVSSALLPGIPISSVHAANNPIVEAPAPAAEAAAPSQDNSVQPKNDITVKKQIPSQQNKRDQERRHEQQPRHSAGSPITAVRAAATAYGFDAGDRFSIDWESSDEAVVIVHTNSGKTFKVHLDKEGDTWNITSVKEVITGGFGDSVQYGNPVDVVKDNAATFGFDADNDTFTLLSIAGGKAIVQVKTGGQTFKVDLERSNGNWAVTTIRGIGNSIYPATYRPASLYGYQTLSATTGPAVTITEQTLYSNNTFADWTWNESAYPADMKTGVLLARPNSTTIAALPDVIIEKAERIDFGRQLVLYAHIGSVSSKGYGIGIEKVIQTGNDLTVTVRMKSPLENYRLTPTQTNDVIPIDRLALDFDRSIHITFVDQNGTTLSNYTL